MFVFSDAVALSVQWKPEILCDVMVFVSLSVAFKGSVRPDYEAKYINFLTSNEIELVLVLSGQVLRYPCQCCPSRVILDISKTHFMHEHIV